MGLIAYTDGSCRDTKNIGPDNPAYYAYVLIWRGINPFDHEDGAVVTTGRGAVQELRDEVPDIIGSNNTAELAAILLAIRRAVAFPGRRKIIVYTDSEYCIKVTEMAEEKTEHMANRGLGLLLREEVNKNPVTLLHIRGHRGIPFNEMADKLAKGEIWIDRAS